ncbi:MAG TPA: hypothetical protein VND40_00430 [Nitrososphaerales archaeon]|nr:hypothetical protein [Nitrososphaerales archaeon]
MPKSMQALGLSGNSSQKVIPTSDVRNFVTQGWEFVNFLPDNEAIVRLPLR